MIRKLLGIIKAILLYVMRTIGLYAPYGARETRFVTRELLPHVGDIPAGSSGDELGHVRRRCEYERPRNPQSVVSDLVYTERGMGWKDGCLHRRYSIYTPSVKDLIRRPAPNRLPVFPKGTILEAEHPFTYGDWILDQFASLAMVEPRQSPVFLPKHLMDRGYLRRDLELLGLEAIAVDRPVLIREAVVLHKTTYSNHWTVAAADACRRGYRAEPIAPRPGSILYLSRAGESSAGTDRSYPSEMAARVLEELGARVVLARQTSLEDYRRLADEAETVVADHGSAMCNLLLWQTKNVIELYSNRWWNGYFFFLGKAAGVKNYCLINIDDICIQEFKNKINTNLDLLNNLEAPLEA